MVAHKLHRSPRRVGGTSWARMILIGIAFELAAGGCGMPVEDQADNHWPTTLGSAIVDDDSPPVSSGSTSQGTLSFSANTIFCCNPLTVDFVVDATGIPIGVGALFEWDFGDGRRATGPIVQHTYIAPGEYLVCVVATQSDGTVANAERIISLTGNTGGVDVVVAPSNDGGSGAGDVFGPAGEGTPDDPDGGGATEDDIADDSDEPGDGDPADDDPGDAGDDGSDDGGSTPDPGDDGGGGDSPGAVTNVPPTVSDQTASAAAGAQTMLTLSGYDGDGDDLIFSIVLGPEHGTLGPIDNASVSTATVLYTSEPGFVGTDTFTFQASDGEAESNVATCTILVAETAIPPTALATSYLCQVDTPGLLTLAAFDPDSEDLTFTVVAGPSHGMLAEIDNAGSDWATVIYAPGDGFEGTDAFTFEVSDGMTAPSTAVVSLMVNKAILPWLEINLPLWDATEFFTEEDGAEPGMTLLEYGLAGIENWAEVTDQVLITSRFGQVPHLYPELMDRKPPHVRIYGGSKPTNLPGVSPYNPATYNFADADGWLELAELAQYIVDVTGTNVFVLENEGSLTPFHNGLVDIDFEELQESLVPLRDTGIEVWWNLPTILEDKDAFPNRHERTVEFVAAVAEAMPGCVFFTGYRMWHGWRDVPRKVALREEMIDLVGLERMQERLIVTLDGYMYFPEYDKRCYTLPESLAEMQTMLHGPVNVWPGAASWIRVAEQFADTLPPLAAPVGGD